MQVFRKRSYLKKNPPLCLHIGAHGIFESPLVGTFKADERQFSIDIV